MANTITVMGHLGADLKPARFTESGLKVNDIRLADNIRGKGKDSKETTIWWRITIFGDRFDKMLPYLKKGSALIVVGEFTGAETYTDKNGLLQISHNLIADRLMFSPFGRSTPDQPASNYSGQQTSYAMQGASFAAQPGIPPEFNQNGFSAAETSHHYAAEPAFMGAPAGYMSQGNGPSYGQSAPKSFEDDENPPF